MMLKGEISSTLPIPFVNDQHYQGMYYIHLSLPGFALDSLPAPPPWPMNSDTKTRADREVTKGAVLPYFATSGVSFEISFDPSARAGSCFCLRKIQSMFDHRRCPGRWTRREPPPHHDSGQYIETDRAYQRLDKHRSQLADLRRLDTEKGCDNSWDTVPGSRHPRTRLPDAGWERMPATVLQGDPRKVVRS